jgi:hypothetical protein
VIKIIKVARIRGRTPLIIKLFGKRKQVTKKTKPIFITNPIIPKVKRFKGNKKKLKIGLIK